MSCDGRQNENDENTMQANMQGRDSPPALDEAARSRPQSLTIPEHGSPDYDRFVKILDRTDSSQTISELISQEYMLCEEVKELLNLTKENRRDWREVAYKMKVTGSTIKKIEEKDEFKEDPTGKLFNEISNEKTRSLLQVLYQTNRHDVLNIFYKYLSAKGKSEVKNYPTPESGESSTSGLTTPDSPTKALRVTPPTNFHSEESTKFWHQIPPPPRPDSKRKEWKEVEAALKRDFSAECAPSQVMRFICYVLKVEPYEQRHTKLVRDHDFANLVAWFGPVKKGEDGLFHKIGQLMKCSTRKIKGTGPRSFFAGYMTKEEADRVITAEKAGTFLIRFSSSEADKGSFTLCLKTDNEAVHILLEGNQKGNISYKGNMYSDLIDLHNESLSREGVSEDERTCCTTICPDLPLNAMMKPYRVGARAVERGGSQEQ